MNDYDRRKSARSPSLPAGALGDLWDMTPKYLRALKQLQQARRGSPKISSAAAKAVKKFDEVIDLLRVIDHEEEQELRER